MTRRTHNGTHSRRLAALAVVPLLVIGPAQTASPSAPTARAAAAGPASNGMIATFAWKPGAHISDDLDLVVMKPDGSSAQVLVEAAARRSLCGFDLDWSPDGNRIAWASGGEVWSIKADGSDRQKVADGCVSHLEWSPDGGTLAVEIDSRTGMLSIPGGAFAWLRSCEYGELGATFSPDGSKVSAVATADCDTDPSGWGVYGFNVADGSLDARYADTNLRSQPPNGWLAAIPSSADWHPSQDLILMTMADGSEGGTCHSIGQTGGWNNSDLFTVTPSTDSPLTKVGATSGEFELSEHDASWSPDGQRILFTGDRNLSCQNSSYVRSGVELYSMGANGSSTTKIWTPWNAGLGFVRSSWQPCVAATLTCAPVPPPPVPPTPPVPPGTTPTPIPLPATAPSRMKAPRLVVRGAKATVRWAAASANGSAVSAYVVDISKGKDKTVKGSVRKTVFRHLNPGRYKFRVAATNAVGTSHYSAPAKIRIR